MLYFPTVKVVYYQDADGTCPVREFLWQAGERIRAQAQARVVLLEAMGHRLRRPHADYLRDGIYELRWHTRRVQYRILYGFHGPGMAVLLHALTKERVIPDHDLAIAQRRRRLFLANPNLHTRP